MIASSRLEKIVRAAVLTCRVARPDVKPISLLLIAPVENGKTSIAIDNAGEKPLVVTDLSGMGLLEHLAVEKSVTHVVINDLTVVRGHKQSVSTLLIAILNGLAEEGCYRIAMPNRAYMDLEGRQIGIIACCTPDLFADNRMWWHRSGFASRILPVKFSHGINLRMKIQEAIRDNSSKEPSGIFNIPEIPVHVDIPKPIAARIMAVALELGKFYNEAGYRRHYQMRALACGLALMRGWKSATVKDEDVDFLIDSLQYFTTGVELR